MHVSLSKQDSSKSLVWLNIPEVVPWEKIICKVRRLWSLYFISTLSIINVFKHVELVCTYKAVCVHM